MTLYILQFSVSSLILPTNKNTRDMMNFRVKLIYGSKSQITCLYTLWAASSKLSVLTHRFVFSWILQFTKIIEE
jgi:hypothetical protein